MINTLSGRPLVSAPAHPTTLDKNNENKRTQHTNEQQQKQKAEASA